MTSKPIFISYSTDDTAATEQILDGLESSGILCWMAPRDIAPGLDYGAQIIDAIEACTVLLLVLSESSNYSIYVRKEVERAIAKGKVVIPFRIQEVTVSRSLEFFISDAQWIDGWGTQMSAATTTLHVAVRGHLGSAGRGLPLWISRRPMTVAPSHRPGVCLRLGKCRRACRCHGALGKRTTGYGPTHRSTR